MVEKKWHHYFFTIGGAAVNALAYSGTNFVFSRLTDHGAEESKRHDLVLEKLQKARGEWNRDRMKRLDLINNRLRERNEARSYIKNVDEALLNYYRLFSKKKIYQRHKNGELLFVGVGRCCNIYPVQVP